MAEVFFDSPPVLSGREEEKLIQIQRYLFTMSDKLNAALMDISIDQMAPETQAQIQQAGQQNTNEKFTSLKSMIVKTAEIVRHEMTEISTALQDRYQALSDQFGEYERDLEATVTATAEGIMQEYQYEERIQALEDESGNTDSFIRKLNQYIFSGLIDEENGKYGIAIGEHVTQYDAEGNPYLNAAAKVATFTMDRLSFWQGETELAYITNEVLHISNAEILSSMKMGNHMWRVLPDNSMALMKG